MRKQLRVANNRGEARCQNLLERRASPWRNPTAKYSNTHSYTHFSNWQLCPTSHTLAVCWQTKQSGAAAVIYFSIYPNINPFYCISWSAIMMEGSTVADAWKCHSLTSYSGLFLSCCCDLISHLCTYLNCYCPLCAFYVLMSTSVLIVFTCSQKPDTDLYNYCI